MNRVYHVAKGCRVIAVLCVLLVLAGCKTSRQSSTGIKSTGYLSSKVTLTVPHQQAVLTVNGTLKLKSGERAQLSFLMPIIRTEVARVDLTPDEVLLVDRMGKRYVQVSRKELKHLLPRKADFAHLEKMLFKAAQPGAKRTLSGKDLGIPSMEKGEIELYDFHDRPFDLQPTKLSQRYRRVELEELLDFLLNL